MRTANSAGSSARVSRKRRSLVALFAIGGMVLAFTACGKGGGGGGGGNEENVAAGFPVYDVSVSNFTYQGMPDTVPANKPFTIAFSNKESFAITHELVVLGLPSGKTLDDVVASAEAKGQDGEEDYPHFGEIADVDTGGTGVATFDLPPGNYVISCWENGKAGGGTGPVHSSIGMVFAFTAS